MSAIKTWAIVFLIIGGLVHMFPTLYRYLTDLTGGTPYIQIIVGIISVIVGLIMIFYKTEQI